MNVPSRICVKFVQLRHALLAVILVRNLLFLQDTYASAMLPDTAAITRDEQTTSIFCLRVVLTERFAERRTRIVWLTADASRYFFLFVDSFLVDIVLLNHDLVLFRGEGALRAAGWLTHLFAGTRMRRCRLLWFIHFDAAI